MFVAPVLRRAPARRLRWIIPLAVATLALAFLPACNTMDRTAGQLVNQLRASRGVPTLVTTRELNWKAALQAQAMADAGTMYHSNLAANQPPGWHTLGENVGRGGSITAIQQAFMASAPHYQDMVNPAFTQLGIGVSVARDGTIYVVQEFRG